MSSAARQLRLEVILQAVDRATKPLRRLRESNSAAARALKQTRERLKQLDQAQRQIDALRTLRSGLGKTATALKEARARMQSLAQEIQRTDRPAAELTRRYQRAARSVSDLTLRHNAQAGELSVVREKLNAAGMGARTFTAYERDLRRETIEANAALKSQQAHLARLNQLQRQRHAAKARHEQSMRTRQQLIGGGITGTAAAATVGLPVVKPVRDFVSFEDAMLGVAKQVDGARDDNNRLTPTYYAMADAIKAATNNLPIATTEFTALIEAQARAGIQGQATLLSMARVAATAAVAFDMPAGEAGEAMGRIAGLYKVPLDTIGALGDTINTLDDNTRTKGQALIEVMTRMGDVADKLDYRQAAALGSTFLSLGSVPETAAMASRAMVRELAVANMQSKRFRDGMQMLRLDGAAIQKSMSRDAMGTILRVLDAIERLPKDQQMEAATRIFGKEFGKDAAKLVNNRDELARQMALVNDPRAQGSMQRELDARKNTLSGRWQMTQNRAFNESSTLGETLRPALMDIMDAIDGVIDRVTAWTQANPALAGALMKAVAAAAALTAAVSGAMLALAAIIGPLALVKLSFAQLGIALPNVLGGLWQLARAALPAVVQAVMILGKALLTNPILLAIAAIAAGAMLIWQHWDTLGPKFKQLWQGITAWFGSQVSRFVSLGSRIVDGLIGGIREKWAALKRTVSGLADSVAGWFKSKLGIHSPSRVFAALGGFTMAGFDQGLRQGQRAPLSTLLRFGRQFAAAGEGLVRTGASVPMDARPPLVAPHARHATGLGGAAPVTINVYPAPGMDEAGLARLVARQLDEHQRRGAARRRSRLVDEE